LAKIAHALHVEVADLLKEPAPLAAPAGAEGIFELLDRLGARTRHIADPGLIRSLETASGAAVMRTVRETRRELELLIPELQRLGDELEPASPGFMPHNKTLAWVSQQVLAFDFFLRSRDGEQPEEEAMRAVSRELLELALAG